MYRTVLEGFCFTFFGIANAFVTINKAMTGFNIFVFY